MPAAGADPASDDNDDPQSVPVCSDPAALAGAEAWRLWDDVDVDVVDEFAGTPAVGGRRKSSLGLMLPRHNAALVFPSENQILS